MSSRKEREAQDVKRRKDVLRRLKAGEVSPEEKVKLYLEGEWFLMDVSELHCSREEAERAKNIDNRYLVEADNRLWYVFPNFEASAAKVREAEKAHANRIARASRSGSTRRRK